MPERELKIVERGAVAEEFEVEMDVSEAATSSEEASGLVNPKDCAVMDPPDGVGREDSMKGICGCGSSSERLFLGSGHDVTSRNDSSLLLLLKLTGQKRMSED